MLLQFEEREIMSNTYRVERDFLGEKQLPTEAYYGIQTLRATENFPITGYHIHTSLIRAMGTVKKAAAMANRDVHLLDAALAEAIIKAATEVEEGMWDQAFIVDPIQGGAGTSINMNANEVIANRALEILGEDKGNYAVISPNSHVNMSQSTNDAFPTAIHIAVLKQIDELLTAMEQMETAFHDKAEEFSGVIKMGRTHLQDAVPIRLGQEFEAFARVIARDITRVRRTKENLFEVNMGATAVGTGLNAFPSYIEKVSAYLKEFTQLPLTSASHLVDATQNTDAYTEVSASLKVCMINMSKIANDLRLMASGPRAGLNEINLPARQPGSSIMPGKVNPVMPEVMNQVAFQVIGNDQTIGLASEAGQFELNVMEPVMVFNLLQSLSIMKNVFTTFTVNCLQGITANEERLRNYVEQSVGIITAVNPHIGYEQAAKLAREAILTGTSIRELCIASGTLTKEQLDVILDPYEMTHPGIAGADLMKMK